jgi:hypothetical protein
MWLDTKLLDREGYTVAQVAQFISRLTQSDVATDAGTQPGEADDPAFQAVFPSSTIEQLPCLPESVRAA